MPTSKVYSWLLFIGLFISAPFTVAGDAASWSTAAPDQKREAIVAAITSGDLTAARYLVQAGFWDEITSLDPMSDAIKIWKSQTDVVDGIAAAQVYGEILANWAVRHEALLGKERMQELMLEARDIISAHALDHPIIVEELRWLCLDVQPILQRSRELRLRAGELFDSLPVPQDPLFAARWFLVKAEQGGEINSIDECFRLAVESAEKSQDMTMLSEALGAWIKSRTETIEKWPKAVDYDINSIIALYARLDAVLEKKHDLMSRATAAWQCGRFLISKNKAGFATPLFALAAKLLGELGDLSRQGLCLLDQIECIKRAPIFLTQREDERFALAKQAISCFSKAQDKANLARAHGVLGDLLPNGSNEALSEYTTEAAILNDLGDKAKEGRALLSVANVLNIQRYKAIESKNKETENHLARQEFSLLVNALEMTKDSDADYSVANGTAQLGWLRLSLFQDQTEQALVDLYESASLYSLIFQEESQISIIEKIAEISADKKLIDEELKAWRILGHIAYRNRNKPDGAKWIERAAEYYAKSKIADPPVSPIIIDTTRDETQGRQAVRMHELCQAIATADTNEQAEEHLKEIVLLLGCTMDGFWINRLYECQNKWMLSRADCAALLRTARIPQFAFASADLITKLGRRPGAEILADALEGMPYRNNEFAWVMGGFVSALERTAPDLAKRHLSLALEVLSVDGLRIACRLMSEEDFHRLLLRGLTSPVWEVKIQALRILNRTPEILDEAQLEAMALDPIPVWGHRVEALHALILRGKPNSHGLIKRLISDDDAPSELRHLAIIGAAFLQVKEAETNLLNLLTVSEFRSDAARSLTYMGTHAHLELMEAWLKDPLDSEFDDRHIIANVALWCLLGRQASHEWLIQAMELKKQDHIDLYVEQALGWGYGERAASLLSDFIIRLKFEKNWFEENQNRDDLQRSLSRLPLTDQQIAAIELVLKAPVPARSMNKSRTSDDTLDGKPQAPLLKPRHSTMSP